MPRFSVNPQSPQLLTKPKEFLMFATQRVFARRFSLSALALTGTLLLAACGGSGGEGHSGGGSGSGSGGHSGSSSAPQSGNFNDADVMFAQGMIPHHQQALDMVKDADTKASNPAVKKLAAQIEKAQAPEIEQLSGWLKAWGKPVPASGAGHEGGHQMPGMMSEADMQKLRQAKGAEYDKILLQMMIDHHNGAITAAKDEQANGKNPDAKALAKRIETTQAAEVKQMKKLLAG
jgi:uncharacterized protein (DUF305 family)